ncbi:hypothetical protein PFISCL1PPCAC_14389, partial [Pristionchus fissidentatus]
GMGLGVTRFHCIAFLTWQCMNFFGASNIFPIFSNLVPQWKCGDAGVFGKDCTEYTRCKGNVTFAPAAFNSTVLEFRWICNDSYSAAFSSQAQFFGYFSGTVTFGFASDLLGRKWVSTAAVMLGLLATIASGLLQSAAMIIAARFCIGLSIGGMMVVGCTYIMELILPQQRMFLRAYFNWGISRILLTTIAYVTQEWRAAAFGIALVASPALIAVLFIFPESPTWLHSKGRLDKMRTSERRIARIAGVEYVPVHHPRLEKSKSFIELMRSGVMRRLLVLWVMWFTAATSSFATDLISNEISGNLYVNQLLFGAVLYASKIALGIADARVPALTRRLLHQGSQAGAIFCFTMLAIFSVVKYTGPFFLVFNIIGICFVEYTWDTCYVCAVESME